MASKGPKPTPTAILKARGSWRGQLNPREPAAETGVPAMPEHIADDPYAVEEWERLSEALVNIGVLSVVDGIEFESLCMLYAARRRTAEAILALREEHGPSADASEEGRRLLRQVRELSADLSKLAASFGLTPSSRSRVTVGPPPLEPSTKPQRKSPSEKKGGATSKKRREPAPVDIMQFVKAGA